ncbi:MAG: restriction endonuclease subunit S [Erysipelotrichaceae bacterium]|nr:restriction endonuclease subunit S [Erysipelotrichaceae bacterium]
MIVKTAIGDICYISSAGDKPLIFEEVMTERCHIPVIANGIDNDGIIGYTDKAKINTEAVTVSARGNVGTSFYRNEPYYPVIRLLTITPKNWNEVNCKYLYYLLKNSPLQGIGSVQAQLTVPDVSKMEVFFESDYDKQTYIADILSTVDSKIANNTAICFNLEAMAKLLYDYWFVQFDFPDENGKPYKSSGGKMAWNEELKREIPEGWKVMKFDDIVDDPPKLKAIKAPDYKDKGKYPIVDQADKLITGYTDDESYLYNNDECVVFGDVTTYFKYINFPFAKGTDGTKIIKSKENRIPALLLYHLVKDSKLPNVGFARHYMFLREVKILVPDKQVCRQYDHLTKNMMNKRRECIEENQQLSSLRDFLLPMLMNGQVKVG